MADFQVFIQGSSGPAKGRNQGGQGWGHKPAGGTAKKGDAAREAQLQQIRQMSTVPAPSRVKNKGPKPRVKQREEQRPAALLRAWVRIDSRGDSSVVHSDKQALTHQLGIQPRDLRFLEYQVVNQTSVILTRERAIVINMAFVKAIITLDACYIVSPDDERSIQFMSELQRRLKEPMVTSKAVNKLGGQGGDHALPLPLQELPFELRVLEICLDELASDLDERATQLEATAYPAVDAMAKLASRPNLDRVRRIKHSLSQLHKTTETFQEALEELLDNDHDMWEFNLGAKIAKHEADEMMCQIQGGSLTEPQHTQLAPVAEDEVLAPPERDFPGFQPVGLGHEPHTDTHTYTHTDDHLHPHPHTETDDPHTHTHHPTDTHYNPTYQDECTQHDTYENHGEYNMGVSVCEQGDGDEHHTQLVTEHTFGHTREQQQGEMGCTSDSRHDTHTQGDGYWRDAGGFWHRDRGTSETGVCEDGVGVNGEAGSAGLPAAPPPLRTRAPAGGSPPAQLYLPTHTHTHTSPFLASCNQGFEYDCDGGGAPRGGSPVSVIGGMVMSGTPAGPRGGGSGDGGRASFDGGVTPFGGLESHVRASPGSRGGPAGGGFYSPFERPLATKSQQHASLARLSRRSLALLSARHGSSLASSSALSSVYNMEVSEVEMLLDLYFMHVNSTMRRLKTLGEYVEDTEEMVYSSLNAKRNRLIAYDLLFIGINCISMTVTGLTALFTMNLYHSESDGYMYTSNTFLQLCFAGLAIYLLFGGLLAYYMKTGIVQFT